MRHYVDTVGKNKKIELHKEDSWKDKLVRRLPYRVAVYGPQVAEMRDARFALCACWGAAVALKPYWCGREKEPPAGPVGFPHGAMGGSASDQPCTIGALRSCSAINMFPFFPDGANHQIIACGGEPPLRRSR